MPFFKVSKVFTEAISEGILMGFFIMILIKYLIPSINTSPIPRYLTFFMILLLLLIRTYRIIYDTILRIKNITKIKPTLVYGIDIPYEIRGEDHFENEKKKNRERKLMKYNKYERKFRRDAASFDLKKSINYKSKISFINEGLNDKSNLNLSNDVSHTSRRKLLTGSNDRDELGIVIDRRNSESQNSEVKDEVVHDPLDLLDSSKENDESMDIDDQDNTVDIVSKNLNRKNSDSINNIAPINKSYRNNDLSNTSYHRKKTHTNSSNINQQIPIYRQPVQFRDNDLKNKNSLPAYKQISKEKIDTNYDKNYNLKNKNNFIPNSILNISKDITPMNGDKTEDMILVGYLDGSRMSNSKSIKDTNEIERKYEEDFANMTDNFKKNIILSDMSRNESDIQNNKKGFDSVSKISKTISNKNNKGIIQSKKNPKLFEIKEENTKTNIPDYSERDPE